MERGEMHKGWPKQVEEPDDDTPCPPHCCCCHNVGDTCCDCGKVLEEGDLPFYYPEDDE